MSTWKAPAVWEGQSALMAVSLPEPGSVISMCSGSCVGRSMLTLAATRAKKLDTTQVTRWRLLFLSPGPLPILSVSS